MQNRWKSPVLWTSLLSAVILVGSKLFKIDLDDSVFNQVIVAILGLLIAFGVVNNPTDKNSL